MTTAAVLAKRLPALDARLRVPEIQAIADRLVDPMHLVDGAIQWLTTSEEEIREIEARFEQLEATAGERSAIAAWLEERGQLRRAERVGLRRRLDRTVIRERALAAVESVGIRDELLCKLVVGALPTDAPAPAVVVRHLGTARRWQVRLAAAQALVAHAEAGGPSGETRATVLERADAGNEHPWVRDACDAWLVADDREEGLRHLVAGLVPGRGRRQFLLRRLRAERLLATAPERVEALAPLLEDPSEHVGIGLAAALVRSATPAALDLLVRLSASPLPRVRLAVAEYAGRSAPRLDPDALAGLLGPRLELEDVPLALRGVLRATRRAVEAHPALAARLGPGIDRVIQADISGDTTELAAAARRTALRVADPIQAALHAALAPRIETVRPGSRRWFTWRELGLDRAPPAEALGAVLAELAREDHGLFATPGAGGVRLWRGDQFGFRGWRFVHELTHPAPNKRQGWSHTVGRRMNGTVRAPPARMAEVTATTTPGERTVIDRDGSWVPALPTVDDLLDAGGGATVHSAFGSTEIVPPRSVIRRLVNQARLFVAYPRLARLRSSAIASQEPSERASFVRTVERELGIQLRFRLDAPTPRRIRELANLSVAPLMGWLTETRDAVLAPTPVSQPALAWFTAAALAFLLVKGAVRRESVRRARASLPLVIGGWGTRGKSGTERIKAGLFHGLGHPVFVKTTGCEAMFISARPGLPAREVFIFRPHDKSSIWEQADMVEQAAGMGARVMLWECMALRPNLVELLEQDWMRDDLVTLTNAFPDHEDIQGPAGHDIATTISSFLPNRSVAITSEQEFLPFFRERARERETELDAVEAIEGDLWGQDLLDLFPYQEHPRNIALVARMAERLGVDRMLAVVTMAENVVPDLGVLRIYPEVRVLGRDLRFINGMSANERTGCITNWRRTGCDQVDVDREPDRAIVVVVNNRADRVARSEVFARIIVQDLSADAYVLIGTNLVGLRGYIVTALDAWLRDVHVRPEGVTRDEAHDRLAVWFARLRIARPSVPGLLARATMTFRGLGLAPGDTGPLATELEQLLGGAGLDPQRTLTEVRGSASLRAAWTTAQGAQVDPVGPPEVAGAPDPEEAWASWTAAVADQVLHARTRRAWDDGTLSDAMFHALYRELFLSRLRPIEDPSTSGDRIIVSVARSVAPGARVTVMGVQNIKGTGLDFAYRWVALGTVMPKLERAQGEDPIGRAAALRELLAFDDYGLVDSGTVASYLRTAPDDEDPDERGLRERVQAHAAGIHEARRHLLTAATARRWWMKVLDRVEKYLDPVDAVRRMFRARRTMSELRSHTVSLPAAAATMQELYARQKGGWLVKAVLALRRTR